MIPRMPHGDKYIDWFYNKGGMHKTIYGTDSVGGGSAMGAKIAKAIGPWDAPASPYTTYFEPVFSAAVYMYTARASEVYKLLPRTTWLQYGDSLKYIETDLAGLTGVQDSSTPFASGSAESAPTVGTLEEFTPAYVVDPWETALSSRTRSTWQAQPKLDPGFIKNYHAELLPNQLDNMLTASIDSPANNASVFNLESINRVCSRYEEASTDYVSAATDPDIWWGKSAVLIDRSADTDDTFGGGEGLGIDIPTAGAGARVLSLDMIDDVIAESMAFSKKKRYIAITGHKTMNEMQKLIDSKQRFDGATMNVEYTINGVSTRAGAKTGFPVASYISNGIEIPFFPTRHAANETSSNRSATITDADIGDIHFIDLDAIEIREAIPITYLETPPAAMLTGDFLKTRSMFLYSAQLLATNFRAHAAVKYLKST